MITDGFRLFRIEGQPLQLLRIRGGMVTPLVAQPDHEKMALGLYDESFIFIGAEVDDAPLPTNSLLRDAGANNGGGNPNHDPETGEFSSGEGGRGSDPNDPQLKYTNEEFGFVPGAKTHNMKVMSDWLKAKGYNVVDMKPSKNKAAAYYSPSNDSFGLNKANPVFENPVVVMRANYKAGHLSNAHPLALVHHEEGHKLYDAPRNFMNNIDERATIKKHLSNYAALNPNEVIAEVHAARMAGMKIHPDIEAMFNRYAKKRGGSGKMYGDAKGDGIPDDAILEVGIIRALPRRLFTDSMGMATFGTPGTSYAEATTQPNPVAPLNSRMPGGGVSPKRKRGKWSGKKRSKRGGGHK